MRPARPETSDWKRHWLLEEDTVFLNHGSFGACPARVLEVQSELRARLERNPVRFLWRGHDAPLDEAREALAAFVGADPSHLVFVTNATTGVNAVLRSLEFAPGDEILTTDHDYNACRNVLDQVAGRSGARVVVASIPFPLASEDQCVEAVLAQVTPRTRLAMLDHVTSGSAMVLPIERLVRELEQRGIDTLVDGAHAPGMLPLALETLRPAYYTGNLHKWTCAPKGAAFLWVRPDRQPLVQPAVISHGNNTARSGHTPFQDRFDWAGTQDPTAWLCVQHAIRWLGECLPGGWPELREHNRLMLLEARRSFLSRLGLAPPCPESMLGSMATLPLPATLSLAAGNPKPPDPLYTVLADEFALEVPVIRLNNRRWIRISSHLHNCPDEYRYLTDVIGSVTLA